MGQFSAMLGFLLAIFITILSIILVPISFYCFYLINRYLFINKWSFNNIDSDKTPSLFEKVQNILSFILYYSIGDGYGESLKLFDDIFFVNNDDDKDDLFKSFKFTIRKLTSIMHKIVVIVVIMILLLIVLAIVS